MFCSCWSTSRSSSRMLATGSPPNEWFQVSAFQVVDRHMPSFSHRFFHACFLLCLFWCLLEDICPGKWCLYLTAFVVLMLLLNIYIYYTVISSNIRINIIELYELIYTRTTDDILILYTLQLTLAHCTINHLRTVFTWPGTGICNIYEFLAYKHPHEVDEEAWLLNDTRASCCCRSGCHCCSSYRRCTAAAAASAAGGGGGSGGGARCAIRYVVSRRFEVLCIAKVSTWELAPVFGTPFRCMRCTMSAPRCQHGDVWCSEAYMKK